MILHELHLENFRRFQKISLEFPENVLGIIGRNGAGKTTLLEAIAWALYGSRAARTEKQLIKRQQADVKDPCRVELIFEIGGNNYKVIRTMRGANAAIEAALYHANQLEPIAVKERGVNQEIINLLGLDQRSFDVSIFAKQKELAALSSLTDERRNKTISSLLNLEAIDLARQKTRSDALEKRKFIEGAQANQINIEELQEQLSTQLIKQQQAESELEKQQIEEKRLALEREKSRSNFEEESKRRDLFQKFSHDLNLVHSRLQQLHQNKTQTEDERKRILKEKEQLTLLLPVRKKHLELQKKKETLEAQRRRTIELKGKREHADSLHKQIVTQQNEIEQLQKKLILLQDLSSQEEALTKRLRDTRVDVRKYREQERSKQADMEGIKTRGVEWKERLQEVQKIGSDSACPVCTRPLKEHYDSVVGHFELLLSGLREDYRKLGQEKKYIEDKLQGFEKNEHDLQKQKEQLSAQKEELRQIQQQLTGHQNRIGIQQEQWQQVQNEIDKIGEVSFDQASYDVMRPELKGIEQQVQELTHLEGRVANLPRTEKQIHDFIEQIKIFEKQKQEKEQLIENLQFREEVFEDYKRGHDEANAAHSWCQKKVGEAQAALASSQTEVKNLDQTIQQVQKRAAVVAQTRKELILLDSLQEHFKDFRAAMSGRLRPLIERRASEILQMATSNRYSLVELDESYNMFLYDNNKRFELKRFSGGEQDLLNLCLRVAISQVIAQRSGRPPLQFIVLDEIFGSQDEERKMLLLSTLRNFSNYFRQIFLITHEESIKESLPVVYEVEMAGDISEVKVR